MIIYKFIEPFNAQYYVSPLAEILILFYSIF